MKKVDTVVQKYLSAEEIFAVQDIETVEVKVPEWGGIVRLRSLSGEEAFTFAKLIEKDKSSGAVQVLLLSAVDANGSQLFTSEDLDKLKKKSLHAIMRLQKEALRINGLTEEAVEATKNV